MTVKHLSRFNLLFPSPSRNVLTILSDCRRSSGVKSGVRAARYRRHESSSFGIGRRGRLAWKWSVGRMLRYRNSRSSDDKHTADVPNLEKQTSVNDVTLEGRDYRFLW